MTENLIEETLEHIKTALKEAGLSKDEIQVIMVGDLQDFQKQTKL